MLVFHYVFVWVLAFTFRLLPALRREAIDFDTYGHLYYCKELAKQGRVPWQTIKIQAWSGELFSHPFFFHSLLSWVPINKLVKNQKLINIIVDSFFAVSIFAIGRWFFDGDTHDAYACVLLYLLTPMWFTKLSMGPRVHNFTPRLITEVLFSIYVCVSLGIFGVAPIIQIFSSAALLFAIILTSKFGLQVVIFCVPLFFLASKDYFLLYGLLLAILLALVVSRGKVSGLLVRQLDHLRQYFILNKNGLVSLTDRNKLAAIRPRCFYDKKELKKLVYNYLYFNSYTAVIFKMPVLLVMGYAAIEAGVDFNTRIGALLVFVVCAVIVYMIVNYRLFLFLGEAERYLSHLALPIVLTAVYCTSVIEKSWLIYFLLLYGAIFWLCENALLAVVKQNASREKADEEVERLLKAVASPSVVLSFPYHNFCVFRIMLNTFHMPIYPYHVQQCRRKEVFKNFELKYPYLNLSKFAEIEDATQCGIVIVDVEAATDVGFENWSPGAGWYSVDLQQSVYRVFLKRNHQGNLVSTAAGSAAAGGTRR